MKALSHLEELGPGEAGLAYLNGEAGPAEVSLFLGRGPAVEVAFLARELPAQVRACIGGRSCELALQVVARPGPRA